MLVGMKAKASRNRTLTCSSQEVDDLTHHLLPLEGKARAEQLDGRVSCGDFFMLAQHLPLQFVDLLILDPPYNLSKNYNGHRFRQGDAEDYAKWFQQILDLVKPTLKPDASIYVCADWKTSIIIAPLLESNFHLRSRITWEREKGR